MNKIQEDFLDTLKEWKKNNWIIFATQSTKRDIKRFWCNYSREYKVTLKSKEEPLYQGNSMEKAYKIYYML